MRLALLTACVWCWAGFALAQQPLVLGATYSVAADHDGAETNTYALKDFSTVLAVQSAAQWGNGTIAFPGAFVATAGQHSLTVSALNEGGESVSAPLLVMVQAAPPPVVPTLGPCPYTNPAGVSSTKPIGDTTVQGFNTYDFTKLADIQKFTAKVQQLVQWGFTVAVTQYNKPKNQVYFIATCLGVMPVASSTPVTPPVTPPPTTGRQSIPPQASIVTPNGTKWELIGVTIIRNGQATSGAGTQLLSIGDELYTLSLDRQWWRWNGTTFVLFGPTAP